MNLIGGGQQGQQNPFSQNPGNDYSQWDPASYMGMYNDPLQQAQNTVSPPSNVDPSTGTPITPGGGTQSGAPQTQVAQVLRQALNPNMVMQAGGGANDIRRDGAPVQGPTWYTPNQADLGHVVQGDPSQWGGPSYAGSGYGYTPVPQPPARTPTMKAPVSPPAKSGDPTTSADLSLQGAGPGQRYGGSASPDPNDQPLSGLPTTAPGPGQPTPEMLANPGTTPREDPNDPYGIGVPDISRAQGGGATGSWTDDPAAPGGSGLPGGHVPSSAATEQAQPPAAPAQPPTPSPSPVATTPREPRMQTGDGQGGPGGQGGQPLTPDQYRQQYDPNSGQVSPEEYEQLYNQRFGQGGQGGQQFNPIQLLMDFLMGGPQGLMQGLQGLSRQMPGGYNYGDQGGQGGQGAQAPWLATGGRAPQGTNPQNYAQASPQQIEEYRRTGRISGSTSPQSSKISGEKGPTPVMTTKEPGPATATGTVPANTMETTPGGRLDPITAGVAGGGGLQGGLPYGATNPRTASMNASNQPEVNRALANPATRQEVINSPVARDAPNLTPPPPGGYGAIPQQGNRQGHYSGNLSIGGHTYRFGTGGGSTPSLPYGTYYLNPGAVGPIGRRLDAVAGISDRQGSSNTVWDPQQRRGREGVEVHRSNGGITNGCIGIQGDYNAFKRDFNRLAQNGPVVLQVRPDGSATIANATGGTATAQRFGQGEFGPSPEGNLAMSGYEHMPRWGQGPYGQFRRSPNVIDRRMENSMSSDLGIDNLDAMNWSRPQPGEPFSFQNAPSPMSDQLGATDLDREILRRRSLIMRQ